MSRSAYSKVSLSVCGATTHSLVLVRRPSLQESDMPRSARKLSTGVRGEPRGPRLLLLPTNILSTQYNKRRTLRDYPCSSSSLVPRH
eukprot:3939432-Rhodomonas_salina.1